MFAELFLPNLLTFAVGQAAAWYYLRTGRYWLGLVATSALWLLLDWWVLARYVWAAEASQLHWAASALQLVALLVAGSLAFALWRRRYSAAARERTAQFSQGLGHYLRCDYDAAGGTFRRLVRTDPWDVAAWIALGDVQARLGQPARAMRCYRRAGAVDIRKDFADLLQLRGQRPRAS